MEDLIYFSKQLEIISKESQMKEKKENNSFYQNKTLIITTLSQKFILLFKLIIFFPFIYNNLAKFNQLMQFECHSSYITLTINRKGNQEFLSRNFKICPDEVYVNGDIITGEICKSTTLEQETNKIKLVWFNEINNTEYMFEGLNNIEEIDLSHFNTSLVLSMQ